jgi:hypothetical protein
MISSPHVSRLLEGLGGKEAMDHRALICIAANALADLRPIPRAVEMRGDLIFVLSKGDVSQFLVNSGFGEWFASTWLNVEAVGKVTGDKPFADARAIPAEAFQKLSTIALHQLESFGTVSSVRIDEVTVYGMSPRGLAEFLSVARSTAQRLPEWQAYSAIAAATEPAHEPAPAPKVDTHTESPRTTRRRRP